MADICSKNKKLETHQKMTLGRKLSAGQELKHLGARLLDAH
jgi:hypothetical protein